MEKQEKTKERREEGSAKRKEVPRGKKF